MENQKFEKQLSMVEVMGHKRLYGYVTEEEHAGTVMVRVDTEKFTQYFTAQAIFSIVPLAPDAYEELKGNSCLPIRDYDIESFHDLNNKYTRVLRQYRAIRKKYPDWQPKEEEPDGDIPF